MKKYLKLMMIACITMISITSCTVADPQEAVFFVRKAGDYRGVDSLPTVTGWNFYFPFTTKCISIPTTIQHIVWSEGNDEGSSPNQHITVACQGGSGFKIDVGLNYRVNPYKASKVYLKYKTDDLDAVAQTYLRNNVRGAMQDVSGYMTVDSLLNYLPLYEQTVRNRLSVLFDSQGFILDNFNILKKPTPLDPDLDKSINAKIKVKQEAERLKMEEQGAIAQANKDIAKARGDSASSVIAASGEAKAIQLKQQAMSNSPQYVEYIKWVNASPNLPRVPSTILGSNTLYNYKP